jgi:hypothetical protein
VARSLFDPLRDLVDVREQVGDLALGVALEADHVRNVGGGEFGGRDGQQFDLVVGVAKLNEEFVPFFGNRHHEAVVKPVTPDVSVISIRIDVDGDDGLLAVAIAEAVFLSACGTFGRRFGVIDHMMDRATRAQVSKQVLKNSSSIVRVK